MIVGQVLPPELPASATPAGTTGKILVSALAAFAERGFDGTSTRAIAAGVGINSATLYSHFGCKEDILAALVTIGAEELLSRIRAALEGASTPQQRLDRIVTATVVAHVEHPVLALVTNRELRALGPERAAQAREPVAAASHLLRAVLDDGVSAGVFDLPDPEVAFRVLGGLAVGIPTWLDPDVHDADSLAAAYVTLARRIVAPAHPTRDEGHPHA